MEQIRITQRTPLLDSSGNVYKPGYCSTNLYDYSRDAVKANPLRIKEWDFYQVTNPRYTLQIVLADISMGGAWSFALFDMITGQRWEKLDLSVATFGRLGLEPNAEEPHKIRNKGKGCEFSIEFDGEKRILDFKGKCSGTPVEAHLECAVMPGLESLVMAVPFKEDKHFYLNQKMNSMPVTGLVKIGYRTVKFDPRSAFCVLDWGRGVWPYKCDWYWGNGTALLEDGNMFGFEIGWGFGDMSAATENMLFYNGKAHKIGQVFLNKDEADWLKPWIFTSDDGRFELTMTPFYDNYTRSRVGAVGNICHQVFGKWNGTATLDDGSILNITDMIAFCEHSDNRW